MSCHAIKMKSTDADRLIKCSHALTVFCSSSLSTQNDRQHHFSLKCFHCINKRPFASIINRWNLLDKVSRMHWTWTLFTCLLVCRQCQRQRQRQTESIDVYAYAQLHRTRECWHEWISCELTRLLSTLNECNRIRHEVSSSNRQFIFGVYTQKCSHTNVVVAH